MGTRGQYSREQYLIHNDHPAGTQQAEYKYGENQFILGEKFMRVLMGVLGWIKITEIMTKQQVTAIP